MTYLSEVVEREREKNQPGALLSLGFKGGMSKVLWVHSLLERGAGKAASLQRPVS